MGLFLGYRDAGTVLLSKCEAERVRIDALKDASNPRTCFGGVTMSKRVRQRTWMDEIRNPLKEEGSDFQTDKDKVCAKSATARSVWLEEGLLLAGKKIVSAGAIYDIITTTKFLDNITVTDGANLRKLVFANLHVFPHAKQRKFLQSDDCNFTLYPDLSVAESSRSRRSRSRSQGRSRSRSQARRQRHQSDNEQVHEFKVGERVRRRDKGKEWGIGYILSLDPLKVTVKDDPKDDFGFRFAMVEPLPPELPKEERSSHVSRTVVAFAGGVSRTKDIGAPPNMPDGDDDPRVNQLGAMDDFL